MKRSRPANEQEERRCALSGVQAPPSALLSFVLAPSGQVVCDVTHSLPVEARIWLVPSRTVLEQAMEQQLFQQLGAAECPPDLPQRVENQLRQRLQELLSLLRRSGALIAGFDKVKAKIESKRAVALVQAGDAAADGRLKLAKLAGHYAVPVIEVLPRAVLAQVTGQENQTHIALLGGGLSAAFIAESHRLAAYLGDTSAAEQKTSLPQNGDET